MSGQPSDQMDEWRLRLACADFSFPLLSHAQALELISSMGFESVDIGLFPGRSHFQLHDSIQRIPEAARQLAARVAQRGLRIADLFHQSGADLQTLAENHPDAAQRHRSREAFLRALELACRCEAAHLTTLPGIVWEEDAAGDSLKRAAEELNWRAERAREAAIVFAVEPHMWSVAPAPADVRKLVELAPGLTLTLDYGHFTTQGIDDREVEPLLAHASHFHARAACRDWLQTDLKHNTIDYHRIVQQMKRVGYDGHVGIEYVIMDAPVIAAVDNVSETIRMRDLLHQSAEGSA